MASIRALMKAFSPLAVESVPCHTCWKIVELHTLLVPQSHARFKKSFGHPMNNIPKFSQKGYFLLGFCAEIWFLAFVWGM